MITSRLPRRLMAALLCVATAFAVVACTGKDAVGGDGSGYRFVGGTQKGDTFPVDARRKPDGFSASLLGGGTWSPSSDSGEVVVLSFWATWCGPCVTEMPQLDGVYRDYKDKGVRILGVGTRDTQESLQAFVSNHGITFPSLFDPRGEIPLELGHIAVKGMPFTVMLDKHGRVAVVYFGSLLPADVQPLLDKLLAEA